VTTSRCSGMCLGLIETEPSITVPDKSGPSCKENQTRQSASSAQKLTRHLDACQGPPAWCKMGLVAERDR
jgi:hypothetical protein